MKKINMTEGNVMPILIRFAIPLMFGDLFQQLYIAVDSVIVGKYAGDIALAAVSSTTFLIRLIIGLFVGISAGASVVIAQCVGAKDYKKVKKTIHTMAGLTLIGGIILTIVGIFISTPLLHIVSTPTEVMSEASVYLRIYLAGSLFELIFNVGSGILRSFGDAKRPFVYLVISSIVNIILDYLFIAIFGWGAGGAAYATIIAQFISAALVVFSMVFTKESYQLCISKIHIEKALVPEILHMGVPSGLQNAIVALSNVMIQANINAMGTAAIAGFGVFNKVDGIIMLPLSSIAMTAMTFTGQNYGAGRKDRVKKGIWIVSLLEIISWIVGMLICLLFQERIFYLFTEDKEIIHYAKTTMWYLMPGYWALGIGYAMTCIFRGMGKSRAASIIFVLNMCVVRQIWILIANSMHFGMKGILISYPFSWIATIAGTICYALYLRKSGELR